MQNLKTNPEVRVNQEGSMTVAEKDQLQHGDVHNKAAGFTEAIPQANEEDRIKESSAVAIKEDTTGMVHQATKANRSKRTTLMDQSQMAKPSGVRIVIVVVKDISKTRTMTNFQSPHQETIVQGTIVRRSIAIKL